MQFLFCIKKSTTTKSTITTILQVVTPISFLKKVILYRFAEDKLHSAI